MKTISFRLNEEQNLKNKQTNNIKGQFLGTITLEESDYVITKVLESENELINDRIDVREIARDFYMDGRISFYSNVEKSEICKKIEELLNSNYNIKRINRGVPIELVLISLNINFSLSKVNNLFINELGREVDEICVTSVRSDLFEKLKDMKNCQMSSFDMYTKINREIEEKQIYKIKPIS